MLYSQLIGEKETKLRLLRMVNEQRVPHALLFAGPDGGGNLPAAFTFAQHLFCKQKKEDGPCDTCSSCLKVSKLSHPDLHIVFPIVQSTEIKVCAPYLGEFREAFLNNPYIRANDWYSELSADKKQLSISVSEANEILKKLSYTSYEGSYKVMVIWLPEKMNPQAQNTILKVLEEPTEKTIFILVSPQPEQLLTTILSRVQQIPFGISHTKEIVEALVLNHGLQADKAGEIALLANGNYAEALSLLTGDDSEPGFLDLFQSFMRLAFTFDYPKIVNWVDDNATNNREKHKQFFQYGLEVFRDCLMYNYGHRDLLRMNGKEIQFLEKFAPFIRQDNFERLIEEFNTNYYYIERNANPKLVFMDLFIKCNALIAPKRN